MGFNSGFKGLTVLFKYLKKMVNMHKTILTIKCVFYFSVHMLKYFFSKVLAEMSFGHYVNVSYCCQILTKFGMLTHFCKTFQP